MIRAAVSGDIPRLVEMGAAFWAASPWSTLAPYSYAKASERFATFMAADETCLFVIDANGEPVGALGMLCGPLWMADVMMAQELFWWVEPSGAAEAIDLWKRGEQWAEEKGAVMSMARLEGLRDGAIDRLYRMRGYRPVEHTYVRAA